MSYYPGQGHGGHGGYPGQGYGGGYPPPGQQYYPPQGQQGYYPPPQQPQGNYYPPPQGPPPSHLDRYGMPNHQGGKGFQDALSGERKLPKRSYYSANSLFCAL